MDFILKIHGKDNVGTCLRAVSANEILTIEGHALKAIENIPQYHKIALENILIHDPVFKYGQIIGLATEEIQAGAYVHVHNIESTRGRGDQKEEC